MKPIQTDIVVVGAGPGGYAAAFYAADKNQKVIMVEREKRLGGVCLNRGCIPSKAYLHASKLVEEAGFSSKRGIVFSEPKIDVDQMREWKESILDRLGKGIASLADQRNVDVMHGRGYFEDSNTLRVETEDGQKYIKYKKAIIAVGSLPTIPQTFDLGNERIMSSDDALDLPEIPQKLLIIGGGYIGMEMGTIYSTLGSQVTLIEVMDHILNGADKDLVHHVRKKAKQIFHEMRLKTKVTKMATSGRQIEVISEDKEGKETTEKFDRVLVAVGRTPNCDDLGLENTHISQNNKGFIEVNEVQQTGDESIYAIGDVAGGPLLAHKAAREARIAVNAITGETGNTAFVVPAVVFTDPELAWCGLSENEAQDKGVEVKIAKFPWSASGRALSFDRPDGLTKLVIEPETERLLGVGIVGAGAGEMISEGVIAIEMGATAEDLASVTHPHPTLSETLMECAERFYGYSTHVYGK